MLNSKKYIYIQENKKKRKTVLASQEESQLYQRFLCVYVFLFDIYIWQVYIEACV